MCYLRLQVIELPIKHPELFEALGVAQPKGVLLHGPPGTGKTLLARAVAHHTDCTFIRVSGSELVQKYIGEGSRMVCLLLLPQFASHLEAHEDDHITAQCELCISGHSCVS
jgi:AAA+ superfamily predicted ATPase